jgi:hypothetical protein
MIPSVTLPLVEASSWGVSAEAECSNEIDTILAEASKKRMLGALAISLPKSS